MSEISDVFNQVVECVRGERAAGSVDWDDAEGAERLLRRVQRVLRDRETTERYYKIINGAAQEDVNAAARGWYALADLKPGVDGVDYFSELPAAKQAEYVVFAEAAREQLADWEKDLVAAEVEPEAERPFAVGDVVRIVGKSSIDHGHKMGSVGKVVGFSRSGRPDVEIEGIPQYIDAAALELVEQQEDRWKRAEDVPTGVRFTQDGPDDGSWVRHSDGRYEYFFPRQESGGFSWSTSGYLNINEFAPFVRVSA